MAVIQYISPTQPTAASGGIVYYRNGGQIAMRSRAYPLRSQRGTQTAAMNAIATLSALWEQLTNAQRIAWGLYAYNVPLNNAWNAPVFIRGYAHYMRSNRPRIIFGLPRIDDGPTTFDIPPFTTPFPRLSFDGTTITVTNDPADAWANEDHAYLLAFLGPTRSPARNAPPENYTPFAIIPGSSTTPPTSTTFTLPTPAPDPTNGPWIRFGVTRADGRYTSSA